MRTNVLHWFLWKHQFTPRIESSKQQFLSSQVCLDMPGYPQFTRVGGEHFLWSKMKTNIYGSVDPDFQN